MNHLETRLTGALTDAARRNLSDLTAPPPFRPQAVSGPARDRWLLPVVAAAALVSLAVAVMLGVDRLRPARSTPPAAPSAVQLSFHTAGDVALTPNQLQATARTVLGRLSAAGISGVSVHAQGSDRLTISGPLTASQRRQLPELLAAGALQFRALITEPVTVRPPAPDRSRTTGDPLRQLGFPAPTDPPALAALTSAQRQALSTVLSSTDCQRVPADTADAPMIACAADGRSSYLLGPAIVPVGQVKAAVAVPPGTVTGQQAWTVDVELEPAAQQSWLDFTSKHNEAVDPGAVGNQVADVLDGKVIVASTVQATIASTTEISGGFTEDSARALATTLAGRALPVSFVG